MSDMNSTVKRGEQSLVKDERHELHTVKRGEQSLLKDERHELHHQMG
jgi:hypothetical protein